MSAALDSVAGVRLLLLSLHPGALSSFLDGCDRPGPIVYIDDAQAAFRDAPFVAGGNTFALLEALRISGNDDVLVDHVRRGLPYIGLSAGSIVAGPDVTPASLMDDPADGPALENHEGLDLIDVTPIPHADGALPPYPPELIRRTVDTYGSDFALLPLRDDQALLVEDGSATVIASR